MTSLWDERVTAKLKDLTKCTYVDVSPRSRYCCRLISVIAKNTKISGTEPLSNILFGLPFTQIKSEENLPDILCHACLYKLNMWSEFKTQFLQSNKILKQFEISEMSNDVVSDLALLQFDPLC